MSFILDALAKAAREKQESQPRSLNFQENAQPSGHQSRLILWLVVTLLLLNFAWIGYLSWRETGTNQPQQTAPTVPASAHETNQTDATNPRIADSPDQPQGEQQAGGAFPVEPQSLKPGLMAELASVKLTSHVWTEQRTQRFVLAGNRKLYIGDFLARELQIEEITETGLIIRYRGTPYELSMNSLGFGEPMRLEN